MFNRILIANRGEIACRVIRTAHRMGLHCIAVYSEADINALHVRMADEAYCLGPAPVRESYLNTEKILAIAKQTKADAIHPGYGFLSENAAFSQQCAAAGIIFVGPPAAAITAMGSKSNAKELMAKAGVPLVPGYHGSDQSAAAFIKAAAKIGYPVLLKAAAGGGGKGMRIVNQPQEMESALAAAKREGLSSFGDDYMLLEKYLAKPRHVEIQIFSDTHGHHLYLQERDCSIQRRHQKIIEEAPAPGMTAELRQKMGQAAVACAQAINYVGAGTIEFLLDEDGQFYFMEMNTRLQVEHPVTEMITGLDLVEWQLRVAAGEALSLTQAEIPLQGHAIEVRIYAEDPDNDFLPSIGKINYLQQPTTSDYVRIDTGVENGSQISQYYDPMIAKLIVWGETRAEAILRLIQALGDYHVCGVQTNLNLLARIAQHPDYQAANLSTHFIPEHYEALFSTSSDTHYDLIIAAAIWHDLQNKKQLQQYAVSSQQPNSPWFTTPAWRMNLLAEQNFIFSGQQEPYVIGLIEKEHDYQIRINAEIFSVQLLQQHHDSLRLSINQVQKDYTVIVNDLIFTVFNQLNKLSLTLENDQWETETATAGQGHLRAPMPGTVTAILVKPGQEIKSGEALIIIEAMKMEHTIHAPADGTVSEICYQVGESVTEGAELVVIA